MPTERRVAGMKMRFNRRHEANRDIARKIAVGPHKPCPIGAIGGGIEVHDLAGRVHTRIRTAGTDDRNRLIGYRGQGKFQRPLDRSSGPLGLPAAKPGPVVLDDTGDTHQRGLRR